MNIRKHICTVATVLLFCKIISGETIWTSPNTPEEIRQNWRLHESGNGFEIADNAMLFRNAATLTNMALHDLPQKNIRGRRIRFSGELSAQDIGGTKAAYQGVKFRIFCKDSDGNIKRAERNIATGSTDWQPVEVFLDIPENVVEINLGIGLESASGSAGFRNLAVGIVDAKTPEKSPIEVALSSMTGIKLNKTPQTLPGEIILYPETVRGWVNQLVRGVQLAAADSKGIFDEYGMPMGRNGNGMWDPGTMQPNPAIMQFVKDMKLSNLRYPGGCLVHNYDWKKAIGPVEDRPEFAFGLDEYLQYCKLVNAEPFINIADYTGTAQDAADLVEYLNMPAAPEYPWAMKRAANGHSAPYGVIWFELGNESDHGNHDITPQRKFTAKEYGEWVNSYSRAMKKVDPSIKVSALAGTGTPPRSPWNLTVFPIVKNDVDFIVVHTYPKSNDFWLSAVEELKWRLAEYRAVIRENTGRDIPIGVTEYNVGNPRILLAGYGAGFFAADYLRLMLEPETNVTIANYHDLLQQPFGIIRPTGRQGMWQKVPSAWVNGKSAPNINWVMTQQAPGNNVYVKLSPYYFFRLWAQHFGSQLIRQEITSPQFSATSAEIPTPVLKFEEPFIKDGVRMTVDKQGGTLELTDFTASGVYPRLATAEVIPGAQYIWSFKGRKIGNSGSYILGMHLTDARGWDAKLRDWAVRLEGVEFANDFQEFSYEAKPEADQNGVGFHLRVFTKERPLQPVNFKLEIKDLKLTPVKPLNYDLLTALSSISDDGQTVFLIVFNKAATDTVQTPITIRQGEIKSVRFWQISTDSLTKLDHPYYPQREITGETISGKTLDDATGSGFCYRFPPLSMTAFEITLQKNVQTISPKK